MWILILTITTFNSNAGRAIEAVPGFTSDVACMVAAEEWLLRTRDGVGRAHTLCVKA